MSHYIALLSIVFMISFVALFDCVHLDKCNTRFYKYGLLNGDEIEQLRRIVLACQE